MTNLQDHATNLILFAAALRERGLHISAQEVGDAAIALSGTGLEDRQTVKTVLGSLFAKSQRELSFFNEEFDEFFVGEKTITQRNEREAQEGEAREQRVREARDELADYDVPEEIAEAYAEVDDKRRRWLRDMMNRVNDSPRHLPLAEAYIRQIATGWLANEGATGLAENKEEQDLLHKSLTAITEEEVPRALALIDVLVRRINGAEIRKWKRAGRKGMPDMRATIHESLRTGGIPVRPRYKKRPRTARRIVVLCDVSESMYRFSGFALRFITAMGSTANKTSAYIFSEGFEEIGLQDVANFEKNVKASGLWRRGTDVGAAFEGLRETEPTPLTQDAILIVLSDAKTIRPDLAAEILGAVSKTVRRVVWLNPDRRGSKASAMFAEHCDMLGCGSLNELAEAISAVAS